MNKAEFVKKYKTHFGVKNKFQLVFQMGEHFKGRERVKEVERKFKEVADFIFHQKELWVIVIMWDSQRGTKQQLENCGFNEQLASSLSKGEIEDEIFQESIFDKEALLDSEIIYLKYERYSFPKIQPLISAIAGYEIGIGKSANISAYFINFSGSPILLNLYDDRGMELLSNDKNHLDQLSEKFNHYIR